MSATMGIVLAVGLGLYLALTLAWGITFGLLSLVLDDEWLGWRELARETLCWPAGFIEAVRGLLDAGR